MSNQNKKKLGIIGGGQLGRMLVLAGAPLGIDFQILDDSDHPSTLYLGQKVSADYSSKSITEFANSCDAITYEFEHLPVDELKTSGCNEEKIFPPLIGLEITRDRLKEKSFLRDIGIPVVDFREISKFEEISTAIEEFSTAKLTGAILKTRTHGYDGKGQFRIADTTELKKLATDSTFNEALKHGVILEKFCKFDFEVSMVGVIGKNERAFYPLTFNTHENGILKFSTTRPDESLSTEDIERLRETATNHINNFADKTNYKGVVTFEFFVVNKELVVNEIAPRVHNSGHWTIEGSVTSQFENHVRAVLDLPLGSVENTFKYSSMVNIIGEFPNLRKLLSIPNIKVHDYNKQPRVGRKLGHITYTEDSVKDCYIEAIGKII